MQGVRISPGGQEKCRGSGLPHPHPPQALSPRGAHSWNCSPAAAPGISLQKQLPPLCAQQGCAHSRFSLFWHSQALSQNPPWRSLFACTDLFSNRFCCLVFPQVVLAPFSLRTGSFTTLLLSKSVCLSLCPRQGWASSQAAEILIRGSLILIRGITPQL